MIAISSESLAETLGAVSDAFFYERVSAKSSDKEIVRWIAHVRRKSGSYAGMFAGTRIDRTSGVKVFTGEMIRSRQPRHSPEPTTVTWHSTRLTKPAATRMTARVEPTSVVAQLESWATKSKEELDYDR